MAAPTIYLVHDMRTVPDPETGGYGVLTNTTQHSTRVKAEARYHAALASAANSDTTERWSAILMTNDGFVIESKGYDHDIQPEPEVTEAE